MFSPDGLPNLKRRGGVVVAAIVLIAALMGMTAKLWQFGVASPFTDPLDFRAFYCAGAAVAQRTDPYRLEPDRSCQRRVLAGAGLRLNERLVLPAPLPPYALVAFGLLALFPYRFACELWLSANIVAVVTSIVLVSKLSGTRPGFVALALFVSAGLVSLTLGQPVPIVLAAIVFSAWCARHGNGIGAAVGASIAAVEPHLALPVWISLGLFVPPARKPLFIATAALAAVTLVPGAALNLEYLRSVIPQHARAELPDFDVQYSLSSLLATWHVSSAIALRAGSVCYAVMLAFGLALGLALKRRFGDRAYVIVSPVAAVVLGGTFLHIQQTVVAIPLAFMLLARLPRYSAAYVAVGAAIVLIAIPWPLLDMLSPSATPAHERRAAVSTSVQYLREAPNESIEIPYAAYNEAFARRSDRHSDDELLARKTPTWLALITFLAVATRLAYVPRRMRPSVSTGTRFGLHESITRITVRDARRS